ncbi:hypothetical protein [Shewanella waksmanii]|uniref:hypothetical protein n=1 Tax=Shewanella waksmanii TaxID=213783 RepID=UPI0037370482
MDNITNLMEKSRERHEARKSLATHLPTQTALEGGVVSDVIGYVGNKVLEGLNAAYENFKKYNINLLQVTNVTDYYMGALAFKSQPEDNEANVNVVAPLPVLINKNTTVDAIYEKGLLDSKKSATAFQWIELSSRDGEILYTLQIRMHLVSVGSSDNPSMLVKIFQNDKKGPLDEVIIEPGEMTGIHRLKDTPFSLAAEVTIGSSVITLIEHTS